jgi:hypothetical protein
VEHGHINWVGREYRDFPSAQPYQRGIPRVQRAIEEKQSDRLYIIQPLLRGRSSPGFADPKNVIAELARRFCDFGATSPP